MGVDYMSVEWHIVHSIIEGIQTFAIIYLLCKVR
jgi:hypothetical protein